jgi:hypothetical protein
MIEARNGERFHPVAVRAAPVTELAVVGILVRVARRAIDLALGRVPKVDFGEVYRYVTRETGLVGVGHAMALVHLVAHHAPRCLQREWEALRVIRIHMAGDAGNGHVRPVERERTGPSVLCDPV